MEQHQMMSFRSKPSSLINNILMSTLNTAAYTLNSVASTSIVENKWKPIDHCRYFLMLMTWFSVWVLRVLMDYFPSSILPSANYFLPSSPTAFPSLDFSPSSSSTDIVLYDGFCNGHGGLSSASAIPRALTHIFALLSEIPATSTKYQFALEMADKIVDENMRMGNVALQDINRNVLSSAFARTANLLHRSLQRNSQITDEPDTWLTQVLRTLPLGSYMVSSLKGLQFCLNSFILPPAYNKDTWLTTRGFSAATNGAGGGPQESVIVAEKHAYELLWITNKLKDCDAVYEAVVQWSVASGLASLSLSAHPRVQASMVKISAMLIRELTRGGIDMSSQIKFRLLGLWLPLFCYASNGLSYPILSGTEKAEVEEVMEEIISSLPPCNQEIILTNWFQDFIVSSTHWPNLQKSYDHWCRSSRKVII